MCGCRVSSELHSIAIRMSHSVGRLGFSPLPFRLPCRCSQVKRKLAPLGLRRGRDGKRSLTRGKTHRVRGYKPSPLPVSRRGETIFKGKFRHWASGKASGQVETTPVNVFLRLRPKTCSTVSCTILTYIFQYLSPCGISRSASPR